MQSSLTDCNPRFGIKRWLLLQSWGWRHHVPPNCRQRSTRLHGVTVQKTNLQLENLFRFTHFFVWYKEENLFLNKKIARDAPNVFMLFMLGIINVKFMLHMELFTDIVRLLPRIPSYFLSLSIPINLLKRLPHRFISHLCQGPRDPRLKRVAGGAFFWVRRSHGEAPCLPPSNP
jgi:hypothetical protein